VPEWFTPPQIARERSIRVGKVLAWIASGELGAVNHAEKRLGRPRWRISAAALAAFDLARSSQTTTKPAPNTSHRRRRVDPDVIEFF